MIRVRKYMMLLALSAFAAGANAQYYNDGQEPFRLKWDQINTPRYRVIFPRGTERQGEEVAAIIDTITTYINFGFSMPARKLPVLLHTGNTRSNGVVVWAPKRAELVTTPPPSTYAVPWLRQLTIHEYRHVVQMSNLYRGTLKAAGYIFGQQATALGAAQLSPWFLEGDAVLAETALTSFGRALQPEFTLEYRAYLMDNDIRRFPVDKWFAGSYRDHIPDHYALGYQLVNHARNRYGDDFWEKVTGYVARNPFFLIPKHFAFKKYYGTSGRQLLYDAFDELKAKWDSLPQQENSARVIETPTTSYTLYSHPLYINDTTVVALKSDMDKPLRFVEVDTRTGGEKHIKYVGNVTSRPIYSDGRLVWTEYKPSLFREQRNRSAIRTMDISGHNAQREGGRGNYMFVSEYGAGFAAAEYDSGSGYGIVSFDKDLDNAGVMLTPRDGLSIHGLSWDRESGGLWAIIMDDKGMYPAQVNFDDDSFGAGIEPFSPGSMNHLASAAGKLLYTSTASGRDEVHIMDIAGEEEYRLTTSQFGSKMPSVSPDGKRSVQVTYTPGGYMLSEQPVGESTPAARRETSDNIFNMPVSVFEEQPMMDTTKLSAGHDIKRYRKLPHAFDLHSWAPASYDPLETGSDRNIELDMGATVMSQNTLGTTTGYLTYGRVEGEDFLRGALQYRGFAPRIEVGVEYGGGDRYVISDMLIISPARRPASKPYFSAYGEISLPFDLSGGAYDRVLTPALRATHVNALVYDSDTWDYDNGYQMAEVSLSYSANMKVAYRGLAPRWGWSGRLSVLGVPSSDLFGKIYAASAGAYVPGVARHHSLLVRGAVQYQDTKRYNMAGSVLFPRGIPNMFAAERTATLSGDYKLPLAYPDGGIPGVIYVKRIYANVFGGFSRFNAIEGGYHNVHSYGADFYFNTNPLRLVNGSVDIRASVYRTSLDESLSFSLGMTIDI